MAKLHSRINFNPDAKGAVENVAAILNGCGMELVRVADCRSSYDVVYCQGHRPVKSDEFHVEYLKRQPGVLDVYHTDCALGQDEPDVELVDDFAKGIG